MAITAMPPPVTAQQLQRFLGMINYYRRFLPAAARTMKPLTDSLKGSTKTTILVWNADMTELFAAIKAVLAATVPLSHPLQMPSCPWPLTPQTRTSAASYNSGRPAIGGH